MNIELKPCSFCGGEAEIREYDNRDIHGYKVGVEYAVGCKDDDSNCLMGDETPLYKDKNKAIEKWNRRV